MLSKLYNTVDKITPKIRSIILIIIDTLTIIFTVTLAFFLRFPSYIAMGMLSKFWWLLILFIAIRIGTFQNYGLYVFLWRYASTKELVSVVKSITLSSALVMAFLFITKGHTFPLSLILIEWSLAIIFIGATRVFLRLLRDYQKKYKQSAQSQKINLLILGAGDAGEIISREITRSSLSKYNLVGFLDDNKNKIGQIIHGCPVLGSIRDLLKITAKYEIDEAIIAMPSATRTQFRAIMENCEKAQIKFKSTPALFDIIDGKVSVNQLREVRIEDLLGRDVIDTDIKVISKYLFSKTILVTGAGGSIGSELCRQISMLGPAKLILLDHSENSVYHIDMELNNLETSTDEIIPIVMDIKNTRQLDNIFKTYSPQIVFHAAAYKHVPLMELNVSEAVHNNVFGTYQVIKLAKKYKCERCVLISTDKAVNPTNVMGSTKRLSEILMQLEAENSSTIFSAVRFGNVLGSQGSVIPLFKKQIAEGGPITITHPEITRFFMTIPEAVRLVIQAGGLSEGGEIFILDMGEPVRIIDLAKDMIHLSGLELGKDIDIKFIGLRPGEKLYEELFYQKESLKNTSHKKIFITEHIKYDAKKLYSDIHNLIESLPHTSPEEIKTTLCKIIKQSEPKGKK